VTLTSELPGQAIGENAFAGEAPALGGSEARTIEMNTDRLLKEEALGCSECGNKDRFIEVMAEEVHLVDRNKTYIKLLEGRADRYLCWECGATLE
jgi:hypothetical protein